MRDLRNELNIDLPKCKGAFLEDAPEEVWGGGWVIEPKIDGNRLSIQIGEKRSLLIGRNRQDFMKGVSRAGKFRNLSDNSPELAVIASKSLDGTILDGEVTDGVRLSGEKNERTMIRLSRGEFVGYTTWGVLFVKGKDVRSFSEDLRYELTKLVVAELDHPKVRLIEREPATKEALQRLFALGEEGAVVKKLDGVIPIDSKVCPYWWKIKSSPNRTVDAFVVGVSESCSGGSGIFGIKRGPNGRAATFTMAMMKDGKEIVVAKMSNLPDEAKELGFIHISQFMGRVAEMRVSGFDGKRFRYPRFVKWRNDKTFRDCEFNTQIGGGKNGRID